MTSQWLFSLDSLRRLPSDVPLEVEMLRRQHGVDWLMRVGATLNLNLSSCLTAATFLHRFYMRRMLEDYHELDIAATCLFLAAKTEENGKRLEDLVTVVLAKNHSLAPQQVAGRFETEAKRWETLILTDEEVLLEVLCFDFEIQYPHTHLTRIFDFLGSSSSSTYRDALDRFIECSWSVAHDSYRTPLCILQSPAVIAGACFLFAQCLVEGPASPTLKDRLETIQSADLPLLQILELPRDDAAAVQNSIQNISVSLVILCQFYGSYTRKDKTKPDTAPYRQIDPPPVAIEVPTVFARTQPVQSSNPLNGASHSFASSDGSKTPATGKSVPSTPYYPTVPPTPFNDASMTPSTPASGATA
ncbi:cyclin-like protein [Serendipita vermifera]|nr:cyclin-like protein [Serendipita vermifera]